MTPYRIVEKDTTESTNDDARALLHQGADDNTIVMAAEQTKGRGRQARTWVSARGNLFCSFIVRPPQAIRDFPLYSFVMALSVRDAVQHFLPARKVQCKWPNDILAEDKKISGILLEVESGALVIGVGVNCAHAPGETIFPATSLTEQGAETTPEEFLCALKDRFSHWRNVFDNDGFDLVRRAWIQHAWRWQQDITVRKDNEIITGTLIDFAGDGTLLVETQNGNFCINSGDMQ